MSRSLRLIPLIVLGVLIAGLVWRLANPQDSVVRSKLVGSPLPEVMLAPLAPDAPPIPLRSLSRQPVLINFFASWCAPCIAEAPLLSELRRQGIPIVGVAVRDRPEDLAGFLRRHGNPYQSIGGDPESKVQFALGSSGVPETFIVDARGTIRYQHVGPIEPSDLPELQRQWQAALR